MEGRIAPDIITYGSIISALERGGQWERALEVFERMRVGGVAPNAYIFTSLISACEEGGQWRQATQLFKQMKVGAHVRLGGMKYSCVPVNTSQHPPAAACLFPSAVGVGD